MEQINLLVGGGSYQSYHEINNLNLRLPLAEQEDEIIKNKCLRALRRMSTSSRFFEDLDTERIMNSASDPAGPESNCEEAIELGQLLGSGAFSDVRAMRRKGRTGSTVEERCSMDLTISTCGVSTIGTMSVDTKSSGISTIDTTSSVISTTDLINKYRFYEGSLSTINDSARLLEEENDEDSEGSQPDDAKYAVKTLRNDLLGETKISGAIDLIIEAHFLSKLSHSHIVKLHGFGGVPGSADFSIVVDRVQENLSSAIHRFRRQRERLKLRGITRTGAKLDKKDKIVALQTDFDDRVAIARQLASALQYLHENSILYRDLKPQNIGLDDKGRVKMFDFGLAKELKPEFKVGVDQYTGRKETGSRRYMAPEVYGSGAYGLPADVFSFTIVFWQLMSFQTPYKGLDMEAHANEVYVKKRRPAIKMKWPRSLKVMIAKGWADSPSRRPKMKNCLRTLDDYLRS